MAGLVMKQSSEYDAFVRMDTPEKNVKVRIWNVRSFVQMQKLKPHC